MTTMPALRSLMVAVTVLGAASALSAQEVTLRTVTPFEPDSPLSRPVQILKEVVERESGGRIAVQILGGPEVVPSQQQFDALRNGVIDIGLAVVPYYAGTVPESLALLYTRQSGEEMRQSGLFDAMRDVHLEKAGLHFLASGGGQPGTAFRFYFKQPVDTSDFTGLDIRVSDSTAAIVTALGGTPVSISFADTYTALERGVVDGFGATSTGIVAPRLHEVIEYVLDEPFYSLASPMMINGTVWNGLSEDIKEDLGRIGLIYEREVEAFNIAALTEEDDALKAAGVEFLPLPPQEAEKFRAVVDDLGWSGFLAANPHSGEEIMALATK